MTANIALYTLAETSTAANPVPALAPAPTPEFAFWLVLGIGIVTLISLFIIYRHIVAAKNWSMSDALSEDVELTIRDPQTNEAKLNDQKQPIAEKVMRASSSRLIALVGSVAILMLYVGAGLAALHRFATDGQLPADTNELSTYFLSGMVLFAPYLVNKFSSVFGATK